MLRHRVQYRRDFLGAGRAERGGERGDSLEEGPDVLHLDLLEVDLVLQGIVAHVGIAHEWEDSARRWERGETGVSEAGSSSRGVEGERAHLVVQVLGLELDGAHVDECMLDLALLLLRRRTSENRARSGRVERARDFEGGWAKTNRFLASVPALLAWKE